MGFFPPAIFEIKAVADQAIAKFDDVNRKLEQMDKYAEEAGHKISGLDKASKVATAGLLAMGAAIGAFAGFAVKEAADAEVQFTKLGQALTNTGNDSAATRTQVLGMIDSISKLGFAGTDTTNAFTQLVTATGNVKEANSILGTAADYARAKQISLSDASGILAKAARGNAKAFQDLGITLDESLPKNEAVKKAFDELNQKVGGQAVAYTKTLAGQMAVMQGTIGGFAESIGRVLIPQINSLLQGIRNVVDWMGKHKAIVITVVGAVLSLTVALAAYNVTTKLVTAATKAWSFASGIASAVQKLLTTGQWQLNAALKANPIGLVVAGIMLFVTAMAIAWNSSDKFRKAMVEVGKVVVDVIAFLIRAFGGLIEIILKVVTGPMRLFLGVLSHVPGVGNAAKKGLELINTGIDGVGNFADTAANKVEGFKKTLEGLKDKKITFTKAAVIPKGQQGAGLGTGINPNIKDTAAQDAIKKDNEGYMKIVKDLNDKLLNAKKAFSEDMLAIDKKYNDRVAALHKAAQDKIDKLNADYADKRATLDKKLADKRAEIEKRYTETYASLKKKLFEDEQRLAKDNADKVAAIQKAGAEKLDSIVKQSQDRLRSAFSGATKVDVGGMFSQLVSKTNELAQTLAHQLKDGVEVGVSWWGKAMDSGVDGLIKQMRTKLEQANKLQENANKLAAAGFSQTFIEQVVSQGGEVGNQMAEAILNSTPEQINEMQKLYGNLEKVSEHGVDALAKQMSTVGHLATEELNKAYLDAQVELANALQQQAADYAEALTELNKNFSEAVAQAEKERTEALADALKEFNDAVAELDKDLQTALAEVNKDLTDALAEAQKDLVEAQDAARKALSESLDAIEKEFAEKLGNIKNATAATIAEINALNAALASAQAATAVSTYTGSSVTNQSPNNVGNGQYGIQVTQHITNTTPDAGAVQAATISGIKFGTSSWRAWESTH